MIRHNAARSLARRSLGSPIHLRRNYYQPSHDKRAGPYSPDQTAILEAALAQVPVAGFTQQALIRGGISAGYPPVAISNILPRGAFELVHHHNISQRLALGKRVQFLDDRDTSSNTRIVERVRFLVLARLRGNEPYSSHYHEAIALMSLLSNIPPSLAELARLSDEIWFLAGDTTVDASWYTKRGALAGVYAASEIYMTQDQSKDFRDTEEFVDRRLQEIDTLGGSLDAIQEWLKFSAVSAVNTARSVGVRI